MFDLALHATRIIPAAPQAVWDVLTDHAGYARWCSEIRSAVLLQEGKSEPNGLGAVRELTGTRSEVGVKEVVNIWHAPRLFGYRIISEDAELRNHQAVVALVAVSGGTELEWYLAADLAENTAHSPDELLPGLQQILELAIGELASACVGEPRP